jgi:hypothetical protein
MAERGELQQLAGEEQASSDHPSAVRGCERTEDQGRRGGVDGLLIERVEREDARAGNERMLRQPALFVGRRLADGRSRTACPR